MARTKNEYCRRSSGRRSNCLQHHAEALEGQSWRRANWPDLAALALVVTIILLIGSGARQMLEPLATAQAPHISLSPTALPNYALRTTIRMLAALVVSLLFTFTYGTAAAKSRRAEMVLIPLLDVLQSVPVLGYLSFTVVFFVSLSPNRLFGAELAAIFAIFTSQAWNMAFSFFQALRTRIRAISTRQAAAFGFQAGSASGASRCPSPCPASYGIP